MLPSRPKKEGFGLPEKVTADRAIFELSARALPGLRDALVARNGLGVTQEAQPVHAAQAPEAQTNHQFQYDQDQTPNHAAHTPENISAESERLYPVPGLYKTVEHPLESAEDFLRPNTVEDTDRFLDELARA